MQDYLDILYPLVPVVHRPTFLDDLRDQRHVHCSTFRSFCFAICSLVLGVLPQKFEEYKRIDGSIAHPNRREAIKSIHRTIVNSRPADYFDDITREKWAIAYLISTANGHLGHMSRAKMVFAEANAMCQESGLHRISSYAGLDKIEAQLRKKAFWLNFTSYSCVTLHYAARRNPVQAAE